MDTSVSPNYYTMVWLKEYAILIKRLKGGTYSNVDMWLLCEVMAKVNIEIWDISGGALCIWYGIGSYDGYGIEFWH